MPLRASFFALDCENPSRLARFWSAAMGYEIEEGDEEYAVLRDPSGTGLGLFLQRVPEPKIAKNRAHVDLVAPGPRGPEVERLIQLGGQVLQAFDRWVVMQDPEGNEFCLADGPDEQLESGT